MKQVGNLGRQRAKSPLLEIWSKHVLLNFYWVVVKKGRFWLMKASATDLHIAVGRVFDWFSFKIPRILGQIQTIICRHSEAKIAKYAENSFYGIGSITCSWR